MRTVAVLALSLVLLVVVPAQAAPISYAVPIPGMAADAAVKVPDVVGHLPGVVSIEVDVAGETVTVGLADASIPLAPVIQALNGAGYATGEPVVREKEPE